MHPIEFYTNNVGYLSGRRQYMVLDHLNSIEKKKMNKNEWTIGIEYWGVQCVGSHG